MTIVKQLPKGPSLICSGTGLSGGRLDNFMIFMIPITVIAGLWVFLITMTMSRARVRELQIRERIAMIEKGMAPAPEVDPQGFQRATSDAERSRQMVEIFEYRRRRRPQRHRSAGVTLVGLGLGLMLMIAFAGEDPQKAVGIGGFVVMLGMAFIVNGMFDQRQAESQPSVLEPPISPVSPSSNKAD